eukprot:jgi/Tetstr1/426538/TSEL_016836.t1
MAWYSQAAGEAGDQVGAYVRARGQAEACGVQLSGVGRQRRRLPTTTGSVILRLARRETTVSVLQTQWTGEGTAILDRKGRRCSTRLLGAPHLDDIERPVHQVWLRSPSFSGITEADMWLRLAEPRRAFSQHRCALTAKAICTGPLANPELPTVEQLAEAIAATISQRINTPPELQHTQWLTDTMTTAGVEMYHQHTEPTLLRAGDDNLGAISLVKEDEEFADTCA